MVYSYLRVSSDAQDVESQKVGVNEFLKRHQWTCDKWYIDEGVSGGIDWRKRKVAKMVKDAKRGDVLVFAEISRIGRKLVDVLEVIKTCADKGVKIYTVKDRYTLEDTIQSKVLVTVMGLAAEIERDLIRQRTKEGLRRAVANGKTLGRPRGARKRPELRKLYRQEDKIVSLRARGVPFCRIARLLKVHPVTIKRFVRDDMDDETRELIGFGGRTRKPEDSAREEDAARGRG